MKNVRLKIMIGIISLIVITSGIIEAIHIVGSKNQKEEELEKDRKIAVKEAKDKLVKLVEVAYSILDEAHLTGDSLEIEKALSSIKSMKFSEEGCYYWITDDSQPTKTIIHGDNRYKRGEISTNKIGDELRTKRMLLSKKSDTAFLTYKYYWPGKGIVENKMSYSKYHPDLGWVISTGMYIGAIDEYIAEKTAFYKKELKSEVIWCLSIVGLVSVFGGVIGFWFSQHVSLIAKKADEADEMEKERLSLVVHNSPVGKIVVNEGGKVVIANQASIEVFPELDTKKEINVQSIRGLFNNRGTFQSLVKRLSTVNKNVWETETRDSKNQKRSLKCIAVSMRYQDENHILIYLLDLTEELELQNQLTEYKEFFDLSRDIFLITDFEGYAVKSNDVLPRLMDITAEELYSRPVTDFKHPDDLERVMKEMSKLGEGLPLKEFQDRWIKKNGDQIHLTWSATPDLEKGLIYCVGKDITDKVKADEELQMFKKFFDLSNDLLCLANMDGYFIKVNPSFSKLLGYTEEDLMSKSFLEYVHPDDKEKTIQELGKLSDGEQVTTFQNRYIKNGGDVIHLLWSSTPDVDNGIGYAVAKDITSIVEERRQRKRYESRFKNVIENVNLISVMLDSNGDILFANNCLLRLSGYEEAELLGRNWCDIFIKEEESHISSRNYQKYVDEGAFPAETTDKVYTKDGKPLDLDIKITSEYDDLGNIERVSFIAEDITEKLMYEKSLRESEEKYRKLVETAPIILYEYDFERGGQFYSGKVKEILGWDIDYLLNKPSTWQEKILEEDQWIIENAAKDFEKGEKFSIEYRIKDKNGKIKWLRDMSINHGTGDKNLKGLAIDITQEKLLSDQIKENLNTIASKEKLLSTAIETAGEGILEWDIINDECDYNEIFQQILGRELDKEVKFYDLLRDHLSLDQLMIIKQSFKDLYQGKEKRIESDLHIRLLDGSLKWVKFSGIIIRDEHQKPLKYISTIIDITDSKQLSLSLQEKNYQLNLIIDSIPGIVFSRTNNETFDMLYMSDYTKEITGYEPEEIISGKPSFKTLVYPEDCPKNKKVIDEAFFKKDRYHVTYRITNKEGETRWFSETGEFNSYNQDEGVKIDGVIFDITEKLKAEERMFSAVIDAADKERARISKEIHDGIQQILVSSYLNFQSLQGELAFDKDTQKRYESAINLLQEGIDDTRGIAHSLMPKQLKDFGFIDSVQNLIDTIETDIEMHFIHNLENKLNEKEELNLYRITQEALNNIIKHSKSKEVFIQLFERENSFSFSIEDDGVGFDADNEIVDGIGVDSIRSRATAIGASLEIESQPNVGTYIRLEWNKNLLIDEMMEM